MKLIRALGLLPALIIVVLMRLIYPLRPIRIGIVWADRLGHLVGNTECYLCERDAGMHKHSTDFFYLMGKVSHPLIWKKYRKQLHIIPGWLGKTILLVNRLFPGFEFFEIGPIQLDRDIYNLWEKHGPHLAFTKAEEEKGKRLLRALGIPEGAKWVCLIVRDSAFLKQTQSKNDYSYHDFRDSDIATYMQACLELIERGYYVIRMGKIVERPMPIKHEHLIDYPFHPEESDFGQLYLGAKCEFCFGASTGFMAIPQVFLRPTAVVNFAPVEYISSWCRGLVIWKHYVKDGKRMTLKEIFDSGAGQFMSSKDFEKANITLEDNTAQEISDVVLELERGPKKGIQIPFWSRFPNSISPYNGRPLHGAPLVRVCREFLKSYDY